jgi:hypothetical protein
MACDLSASAPLGSAFHTRLEGLGAEVRARHRDRYQVALGVARFAVSGAAALPPVR